MKNRLYFLTRDRTQRKNEINVSPYSSHLETRIYLHRVFFQRCDERGGAGSSLQHGEMTG